MGETILVVNRSIPLSRVSCSILENSFRFAPGKDSASCRREKAWPHGRLAHDVTKRGYWRLRYHRPPTQHGRQQLSLRAHLIKSDTGVATRLSQGECVARQGHGPSMFSVLLPSSTK
jgi:hypothetical protein